MASLYHVMRQLHLGYESSEEEEMTLKMNTILVVKWRSPEEDVQKVHQVVLENRIINIDSIVQETGLSVDTIHTVLHEHLSVCKVCLDGYWECWRHKWRMPDPMISTALLIWYKQTQSSSIHVWL